MSNSSIVPSDITSLLDQWIKAEKNGVQFPVPLHDHWNIAGHKYKKNAFELVESLLEKGIDYLPSTVNSTGGGIGRGRKGLVLSVSALEHFCMAAHTDQGKNVRELYRQSKAKWDLVKEIAPEIAQEVEILKIKRDIATQEAIAAVAQEKALTLRHWANSVLEPADRDRVLGVTEIKTVEYRRTIVDNSGFVLNAGETLNKGQLCEKFGFVTRTGKPDYKAINALIEEAISNGVIKEPWREVRTLASLEFDAELLPKLKAYYEASPIQRQRWMGEQG